MSLNNSTSIFLKILAICVILCNVTNSGHKVQKRYTLLFPRTTVLQLTYGLAIPIVLRNKRQFVVDNSWQQNFDLPFNLTNFQPATYYARTAMHTIDITRERLYVYIMNTLDNLELDGEQCLLRAICDVAHTPFHVNQTNSILEKIAQFIFTPSSNYNFDEDLQEERGMDNMTFGQTLLRAQNVGHHGENCREAYPKCLLPIIDVISQKYYLS